MPVLALSTAGAVLIGVGSGLIVLIAGLATLASMRRPRRRAALDIPTGMRPGPSDAELERPLLEKLLAWGAVATVFMAVWIPVVWLREPETNADDLRKIQQESVERGHLTTLPGGEENPHGFNCERCHGPGLTGGQNVYNNAIVAVPSLVTVCGGADQGHPLITSLQDVIDTVAQGRPNTDMPSWSVQYAGAMNDAQIQDVVNYLLSIQEVPDAENVCLQTGGAAEPASTPTPSPQEGAEPSPGEG
jgi:mono/diheme cytochrome c family protein